MISNIISTGSQGNAVVINDTVLIDCGVSFKALSAVYRRIKLVLLTHIHTDHFKTATIARLARERPALRFGSCAWLVPKLVEIGVKPSQIDVFKCGTKYSYKTARGHIEVVPVSLKHDTPNCAYKLFIDDEKCIYATDTSTLDNIRAPNYDLYLIEANYVKADVLKVIAEKDAVGEYAYERRKLRTHLSKEQAINWLFENMGNNSRYEFLHGDIDE